MSEPSGSKALEAEVVRRYYRETHEAYLHDVGRSLQGALFKTGGTDREVQSNRLLGRFAKFQQGDLVLDAGSGFCGPSIDIASSQPGLSLFALTISDVHAREGRARVAAAGLTGTVRVVMGDYHEPPFQDGVFDHVLFVESFGHSYDQPRLLSAVARVLKPGGRLFVKDFFVPDRELSEAERRALTDWDETFKHDTQTLGTTCHNLERAGFRAISPWDVSHLVDFESSRRAMYAREKGGGELTEYGKLHEAMTRHECFPLRVVILRCVKA